jgi:hypothetical protein
MKAVPFFLAFIFITFISIAQSQFSDYILLQPTHSDLKIKNIKPLRVPPQEEAYTKTNLKSLPPQELFDIIQEYPENVLKIIYLGEEPLPVTVRITGTDGRNFYGQKYYSEPSQSKSIKFDFPPGIYLAHFTAGNESFIKQILLR